MSQSSPFQGLEIPDAWQQEAVTLLRQGHDVLIDAPTGAGKTRIFELFTGSSPARNSQAVFAVPTRALANDKYGVWKRQGRPVGLLTGDASVDPDAPILVATLETQRERLLRNSGPDLLAIDEYQMLADPNRGLHYETAIALAPNQTRLLLLSGSVSNPGDVAAWLARLGRSPRVVASNHRPVPLEDLPIESLPVPAPRSVKGFFPRLAAEVLLGGLAPLLIFAPQRHTAESIARKIADALPCPRPLDLDARQIQAAGKALTRVLHRRVAFHHSGMSYLARAGLVEPLARAGQLRVIVATMGLASGIDFSVRSTFIAASSYFDGPFLHELQSDELLQMFGRAGRRGRDECGYALSSARSPQLSSARAVPLARPSALDWPAFLRTMHSAATAGRNSLEAAAELASLLFRREPPPLGLPVAAEEFAGAFDPQFPVGQPSPFLPPRDSQQILNHRNRWERRRDSRANTLSSAGKSLVREGKHWVPCLESFRCTAGLTRLGQVCRLSQSAEGTRPVLGKEVHLGHRREDGWIVARRLAKVLNGRAAQQPFARAEDGVRRFEQALPRLVPGARIHSWQTSQDSLLVRLDLSQCPVTGYRDRFGVDLVDPPTRSTPENTRISLLLPNGSRWIPPQHSPLRAWRELGLISASGEPTRRGIIASFYQHGEGLAIAAALEQDDYSAASLALHIANLRGGHRFAAAEGGDSERLAAACRDAYGAATHEGYLQLGIPVGYGEGVAEALQSLLDKRSTLRRLAFGDLGHGDLERACREWISLLRRSVSTPALPWTRWTDFQQAAARLLEQLESGMPQPVTDPSLVEAGQLQGVSHHSLSLRDFQPLSAPVSRR